MASATTIEWTDLSHNPIRARRKDGGHRVAGHFCQKISPGCLNCYSSKFQPRFKMPQFPGTNKSADDVGVEVFLDEKVLNGLLKRRKPGRVFWCDMSDLFGDWVPFEMLDKCFATMSLTPHLTHQILTKRPERAAEYLSSTARYCGSTRCAVLNASIHDVDWKSTDCIPRTPLSGDDYRPLWPLPNVWIGTSIENQSAADERLKQLFGCVGAIRYLSVEPLIGVVDLHDAFYCPRMGPTDPYKKKQRMGIDWVIIGCESKGAYPGRFCKDDEFPASAHLIVDQCRDAGVPVFMKQFPINCKVSHNPEEWPEWARVREFPKAEGNS